MAMVKLLLLRPRASLRLPFGMILRRTHRVEQGPKAAMNCSISVSWTFLLVGFWASGADGPTWSWERQFDHAVVARIASDTGTSAPQRTVGAPNYSAHTMNANRKPKLEG
jgi:hypothetical protein